MSRLVKTPSRLQIVMRGSIGACGVCGKWRMSRRWLSVSERCPRCNFAIERNEGHFVGAVGMNTIVTFGSIAATMVIALILTAGEPLPALRWAIIAMVVATIVGTVFFPISKTLWSAIDLVLVPLEPGEVDPRYDPSVTVEDSERSTGEE